MTAIDERADKRPAGDRAESGAVIDRLPNQIGHVLARIIPLRTAHVALDRPILTITFDDFPTTAHETGAALVEQYGGRATYFTATGLLSTSQPTWTVAGPDAVRDLAGRGHEIALHTHAHRPVFDLSAGAFAADMAANRAGLRRLVPGLTGETFAYPYGFASLARKRQLAGLARASRSIDPGINVGRIDLDFVRAVELINSRLERWQIEALIDEARSRHGWLMFFTHDVCDQPSRYGITPELLERTLAGAARQGFEILTFRSALDRIGAP